MGKMGSPMTEHLSCPRMVPHSEQILPMAARFYQIFSIPRIGVCASNGVLGG